MISYCVKFFLVIPYSHINTFNIACSSFIMKSVRLLEPYFVDDPYELYKCAALGCRCFSSILLHIAPILSLNSAKLRTLTLQLWGMLIEINVGWRSCGSGFWHKET